MKEHSDDETNALDFIMAEKRTGLIREIADQVRRKRAANEAPLGGEGWLRAPADHSAGFAWYFRKERKTEPRVYSACGKHGELLRAFGFSTGKASVGKRISAPASCILCVGGVFEREVTTCRCDKAPRQCPIIHHRWHH